MLTRVDVEEGLTPVLEAIVANPSHIRVVGTASSVLRGIDLPAGDVDVLASDRDTVDELAALARAAGARMRDEPTWLESSAQYFARYEIGGAIVEFSTVERSTANVILECAGEAPWSHFDVVPVRGCDVPVVASELRLASEVMRGREENWRSIARHLAASGHDEELLQSALAPLPADRIDAVRSVLAPHS